MGKYEVLCHNSIKIKGNKIIYIDPYKISENYNDADYIFCTHSHYDHFSEEDIEKVMKTSSKIYVTRDLLEKTKELGFEENNIVLVNPDETYYEDSIEIKTIKAYNINKKFHPKENNWVGYILKIEGIVYYVAGDTDITEENQNVKCDIAFVPVGGTYTMTAEEAASLINRIKPKIAIPIHYGEIVGTKQDAKNFINKLDKEITGKILIN